MLKVLNNKEIELFMEKYNECIFEETDLDQIFKEEEMSEYDINMNNYLENDSKIEDKNPDSENIRTKTLDNNFIISKNKNSNKKMQIII